jgi:hypothetical protein
MTADYNGWNDAPEAEREAIDEYTRQELEREALAEASWATGTSGRQPETSHAAVAHQAHWRM